MSKPCSFAYSSDSGSLPWLPHFSVRVGYSLSDTKYSPLTSSVDGHRTSIIDHTINVLFLPGLHSEGHWSGPPNAEVERTSDTLPLSSRPKLSLPGLKRIPLPSPLHLRLRVFTRLTFNEQGRIVRHRDIWDVRDLFSLIPGVAAAQWLGSRAAGLGLTWTIRFVRRLLTFGRSEKDRVPLQSANASSAGSNNALGLQLEIAGVGRDRHDDPDYTDFGSARMCY